MTAAAIALVLAGALWPAPARADSSSRVHITLEPARTRVAPGGDLVAAVVFDHDPRWHIHTHHPVVPPALGKASFYIATDIAASDRTDAALTPHFAAIQWPKPHTVKVAFTGRPVDYDVYTGRAIAYLPVTVSPDAAPGEATLAVKVTYQACNDRQCLMPVRGRVVTTSVRIAAPESGSSTNGKTVGGDFAHFDPGVWAKIRAGGVATSGGISGAASGGGGEGVAFDFLGYRFAIHAAAPLGFAWLLVIAGLGGALLNFTPCVLPVVPLKVLSLSKAAGGGRGRALALGLAMGVGVVGFWLAIGAMIATLTWFSAVNRLFQLPWFPIVVGVVIAGMAVGMCGLFSVRLPRFVYRITPGQQSLVGSAGFGVMTAVLSTPCTAPLMGAAAAWAALQSTAVALATFGAIGAGMALPYVLLSAFPRLIDRLPRTGPGSALVKQLMGLLMLAVAAYFIGGAVSALASPPGLPPGQGYWWAVAAFLAAAGLWLLIRLPRITRRPAWRAGWAVVGALAVALAIVGGRQLTAPGPIAWVAYTPDRFAAAKARGDIVVMDFTAQWCLNCKVLEQGVLRRPRVARLLGGAEVTPMRVDITSTANREGQAMLAAVHRLAIPLLVVFSPDGREVFKSDFYTAPQVIDAVEAGRR